MVYPLWLMLKKNMILIEDGAAIPPQVISSLNLLKSLPNGLIC